MNRACLCYIPIRTVNNMIRVLRLGSSCYWLNPPICPLLNVTSQTCLFKCRRASPHSRQIISASPFPLPLRTRSKGSAVLLSLWMGTQKNRKRKSGAAAPAGGGGGDGGQSVLKAVIAAAACVPLSAAGSAVVLQRGLWEVLALRGQLGTPPSSCFDRHPALSQTFSLFHFICGPFPIICTCVMALCGCSIKVKLVYNHQICSHKRNPGD